MNMSKSPVDFSSEMVKEEEEPKYLRTLIQDLEKLNAQLSSLYTKIFDFNETLLGYNEHTFSVEEKPLRSVGLLNVIYALVKDVGVKIDAVNRQVDKIIKLG